MVKPTKLPARKAKPSLRPTAPTPAAVSAPPSMVLMSDVSPMGDGRYVITPRKPVQEVGTRDAAKLLGYKSTASIFEQVLNHPLAEKHLKWHFTPGGGKIWIELASLMAFRDAIQEAGK